LQRRCPGNTVVDTVDRLRVVANAPPGLLDELPPPPVALVGTSFSETPYHLADYLRASLQAEVLTVATPGGGALSSLATWVHSEDYAQRKPLVLVWELSVAHLAGNGRRDAPSPGDDAFYDELLPAFPGDCPGQSLAELRLELGPSGTASWRAPGGALAAAGLYLAVSGEPALLAGLGLTHHHRDRAETHVFSSFARVRTGNTVFLDLSAFPPLDGLDLRAPPGREGTVGLRACAPPAGAVPPG
jgi:hypothetical protein